MAAAWPGIFVHDSNLKVNMWSLRRSLGDTQIEPVYIATVARRGYKFIADVQTSIAEIEDDLALAEPVPLSRPPLLRGIVGREADMADIADLLVQKQARHPGWRRRGRQDDSRRRGGAGLCLAMPRRHRASSTSRRSPTRRFSARRW